MSTSKSVVLITGTSSGFGKLLSMELSCDKGIQVIASMRNAHRETELHQYVKKEKTENIEIVELDVTDSEENIFQQVDDIVSRYGKIDILINNAGYAAGGLAEDLSVADYRKQLEVNFFGLVAVTKAVIPHMRRRQCGKVINISSVSGRVGFPGLSPYVSSKFAVEGFSESLRTELVPYGVYVVLIEPGAYKTDIWNSSFVDDNFLSMNSADAGMFKNILTEVKNVADHAGNPDDVVKVISKVINTKRPKLRYLVGGGLKGKFFLRKVLPEKWIEDMIVKRIKGKSVD